MTYGRRSQERAQRMQAVVRDLAGPDKIPQRVLHLGCEAAAERGEELREEERAARRERFTDALMRRALVLRHGRHQRRVLREIKGDLSVARADRPAADPDRGTGREERVKVALVVGGDARRENAHLEVRRGDERALELRDRIEQRRFAGARRLDAVPGEREARERNLLDRLDL